jgi:glucuronokinase
MRLQITVPARINILGNPSDGNEGDFATISAAVNLYAGAIVEPAPEIILQELKYRPSLDEPDPPVVTSLQVLKSELPSPITETLPLMQASLNRLYDYNEEFRHKVVQSGLRISVWSDVPRQSGLGGSSLIVILTLAALRAFYKLNPQIINDYILAELTQRTESLELGITCGFADRYVPILGGLAYMDYRNKLFHQPIGDEPLVTYERLDHWVEHIPLLAISTGVIRDSGDVHSQMRPRYLQEYEQWQKNNTPTPPMVQFMHKAYCTAWRGKIALLHKDWVTFGELMNENHRIVDEMMTYCGFIDGAGWANNMFIESALAHGALGAKLTGAGGGGSVFALVSPGDEDRLVGVWQRTASRAGLTSAQIYQPKITGNGLVIEEGF